MVKVDQKAVGMTPVVDSIKEETGQAAARRLVTGHALADQTDQASETKSPSTGKVEIATGTALIRRAADRTGHANHLIGMATGRAMATENHSTAMADHAMADHAVADQTARLMVTGTGTTDRTDRANRLTVKAEIVQRMVIVSRSAVMEVTGNGMTGQTLPASHLTGTVMNGRVMVIASHSTGRVDQIVQLMVIASRSIGKVAVTADRTAQHMATGTGMTGRTDHANPSTGIVTNGRVMVTVIRTAPIRRATDHASHLTVMADHAMIVGMVTVLSVSPSIGTTGQQDHAKATVPVLIAVTVAKGLMNARNVNHLLAVTAGKVAQNVHSSASRLLAVTAATVMTTGETTVPVLIAGMKVSKQQSAPNGRNSNPATRMVRPGHVLPAIVNRSSATGMTTTRIARIKR